MRVDVQPQLRRASRRGRPHAPRVPADGRGRGDRGALRRYQGVELMEPVTTITGHVTVLDRADVDTDQIIPKQFLKRIERTGYGEFLFYDWVRSGEVTIQPNPVLVAGRNFGCGSSREHAVWAIQQFGFDAVIAPSFSDIFFANCTKNGLLPVELTEDEVRAVASAGSARIDLAAQTVTAGEIGRASCRERV